MVSINLAMLVMVIHATVDRQEFSSAQSSRGASNTAQARANRILVPIISAFQFSTFQHFSPCILHSAFCILNSAFRWAAAWLMSGDNAQKQPLLWLTP
jgi:hypothetical protein